VFTVGDLSRVWLVANVRESDAPKMKVGAPVEVSVLAYPGRIFNARLAYVAPALDPNTRRLPVRAEIDNPGRELLPEMFASFRIVGGRQPADAGGARRTQSSTKVPQARVWVAAAQRQGGGDAADRRRRDHQRPGRGNAAASASARPWWRAAPCSSTAPRRATDPSTTLRAWSFWRTGALLCSSCTLGPDFLPPDPPRTGALSARFGDRLRRRRHHRRRGAAHRARARHPGALVGRLRIAGSSTP
jgi:hypothetical protein